MVTKKVLNTSVSALVPPDGPTIPAGGFRIVQDWEKKESNEVVKAWIRAGALVVSDPDKDEAKAAEANAPDAVENAPAPAPAPAPEPEKASDEPKTEAELNALTNDELKAAIESKGGTVKSSWNKAELVAQALELKA